jgi:hypothetical protein
MTLNTPFSHQLENLEHGLPHFSMLHILLEQTGMLRRCGLTKYINLRERHRR